MHALEKSDKRMNNEILNPNTYPLHADECVLVGNQIYRILKPIGRGGMGDVYLVENYMSGKQFALKHLYYNYADNPMKYYNKLKLLAELPPPHPCFVWPLALSEFNRETNSFYYVMPLVEKGYQSLGVAINNPSLLTQKQKLSICKQLADAFRCLHDQKLIYGDPSANNFLFRIGPGGVPDVKIIDCDTTTVKNLSCGLSGTGRYRAPEILRGLELSLQGKAANVQHTIHSDIHALTAVLFHLLMGCNPLDGRGSNSTDFNEEDLLEHYGRNPVYIFDPDDHSNPPLEDVIRRRFTRLSTNLQCYFSAVFMKESLMNPQLRPGIALLYKALKND